MHGLNPMATEPGYQPFSPVRLSSPDVPERFAKARRLVCDVGEGDVLYLPSYWWHHVEAFPTVSEGQASSDKGSCPMTASVNYFFAPYFRKGGDLVHFTHESFYDFLRVGDDERAAHPERWRGGRPG